EIKGRESENYEGLVRCRFMKMNIKSYWLSFALIFFVSLVFGQNVKFIASVSSNPVAIGEQFEVTFSLTGSGEDFRPPSFRGFQILSGPNVSSSVTIVNGNMSSSNSYSYYLTAEKEGVFAIEPATILDNGHRLKSNSLQIRVVRGTASPNNSRAQSGTTAPSATPGNLAKSTFIRAEVNKTNVFQGEQLVVRYKLYTRLDIIANEPSQLPQLNGFWSQDLKNMDQNTPWTRELYKGVEYNVAPLKETILFPEHSGNLVIDPLGMNLVVKQPVKSDDIFDQFFGSYEEVKVQAKSKPITIHVKPLPLVGKPESFFGAVGNFSIDAKADKQVLKANEAINYQLKVSGTGNLKLLQKLNLKFPISFEVFDPKITDSLAESLNGVSGKRVYTYVLVPRQEGNYAINGIKFSYFNPVSGKYVTLSAPVFNIKVNKGDPNSNVAAFSSADKQDVTVLDKDIRYIKTSNPKFYLEGEGLYGSTLYYFLLATGPILFLLVLGYRKWDELNNKDVIKVRGKKAGKIAAKHLATAQNQLKANNAKAFYDAVFKGLYGYLSDKLNIPAALLSKENISQELKARSVNDQSIVELNNTLDLCELARYAPVSTVSETDIMTRARNIINDIENQL
ncbi:MAG: hypothetical protein JWQ25_1700, partial [Daejeonella sp.]|nr:hypothetical protein [Daejeonella sp.]